MVTRSRHRIRLAPLVIALTLAGLLLVTVGAWVRETTTELGCELRATLHAPKSDELDRCRAGS